MTKKTYKLNQLYKFYNGKNAKIESTFLLEVDGIIWVAWQAAEGSKAPSMMLELKQMENGDLAIIFNEPLGIYNCTTGSGCSQCKIPCGCGRNGGGGSCIETKTDKIIGNGSEPAQILMG